MNKEMLAGYGVDIDKGLKNCIGNEAFYRKILSMFLQDQCFAQAKIAFDSGNRKELFNRMHEMKGISGNAALTELYARTIPLVEKLRVGGADDGDISPLFIAAQSAYERACEGIRLALQEN